LASGELPGAYREFWRGAVAKNRVEHQGYATVLSFHWHIVDFESSSKPLLTSDRPCVYTEGLDKPNCVIALPLSPRHAFFAFPPDSNAQRVLMKTPSSRLAEGLNESVVGQAVTRAYSQSIGDAPDEIFRRRLSGSS